MGFHAFGSALPDLTIGPCMDLCLDMVGRPGQMIREAK